ncbi:MAG: hypothetical protein ACK4NA_09450 [Alphaproteobacteria bacterium]
MINVIRQRWSHGGVDADLWALSGEGPAHLPPAGQLAALVDAAGAVLARHGLSLDNLVHQRLWLRERGMRDEIDGVRRDLLRGPRRCASSSFYCAARMRAGGGVALDLLTQSPTGRRARRIVDFAPPRRYAWYLLQDGWQHFSGMAESADGVAAQFDAACGQIERGLAAEGRDWRCVTQARLFLERGQGEENWLRDAFARRSGLAAETVAFDWVDGLASADKHLEIEAVARPI